MKIVVDVDLAAIGPDPEIAKIVVRRRLLHEARTDVQLAGFPCTVVGRINPDYEELLQYMISERPTGGPS